MKLITIEREYGSGGTQIARELAERCHIPCYGEEILKETADRLNLSVSDIRNLEETSTNSLLYTLFMLSQSQSGNNEMLTNAGRIYVEEQRIINELSELGDAIFLGHCAGEAIKNKNTVRVFIYANDNFKTKRIHEQYGIDISRVEAAAKKNNKRRSTYYYAHTQKKWNHYKNYDIILNSSELGIDGCVDILEGLFRKGH